MFVYFAYAFLSILKLLMFLMLKHSCQIRSYAQLVPMVSGREVTVELYKLCIYAECELYHRYV